jgi:hypothetical protein
LAANTTDYHLENIEGNDWYANICGSTTRGCKESRGAPAIMVNRFDQKDCYVMGYDLVGSGLSLLDPTDAGRGLTMKYKGGDANQW